MTDVSSILLMIRMAPWHFWQIQREIARLKQTEFQEIWKRFDQEATRKTLLSALMRD